MNPVLLAIIGSVFIIALALIMCLTGFNLITTSAVGGMIASGFWLLHVYYCGISKGPYEFLAAFSWFVFSMVVFIYDY